VRKYPLMFVASIDELRRQRYANCLETDEVTRSKMLHRIYIQSFYSW
jgi:hypothetical protein